MATITVNLSKPTPFSRDGEYIYRVTDSSAKGKKHSVKSLPSKSSKQTPKTINFGEAGNNSQNKTKEQTERYYSRAFGIKDKNGNFTVNNPMSSNFWAVRHIWGNSHGIKEIKSGGNTFKIVRD